MHSVNISSEEFKNHYVIFIDRGAVPFYNEYINRKHWNSSYNVCLLNSEFDSNLSCIVMPSELNYKAFVEAFLDYKITHKNTYFKQTPFWGQLGMDYHGKYWSLV
jgi:hypothetical protein